MEAWKTPAAASAAAAAAIISARRAVFCEQSGCTSLSWPPGCERHLKVKPVLPHYICSLAQPALP